MTEFLVLGRVSIVAWSLEDERWSIMACVTSLDNTVPCFIRLNAAQKSRGCEELLGAIDQRLTVMNVQADPEVIVTDFEVAAMQAVRAMFDVGLTTQGCFLHLTQSTWRKLQELGLAVTYKTDDAFRHFCGMLNGLAFLPVHDVKDGMSHLKTVMPASAADVVKYFDETYTVRDRKRAQHTVRAATSTGQISSRLQ